VQLEALDSNSAPFIITQQPIHAPYERNEPVGGGGMFGMGNMPEMYNLVVNTTLNWPTAS
jgi:molecular chaperone HtpG